MKVLVTGGAGYIGSATCSALEDAGHLPIVLDSLVSGPIEFVQNRIFYQGDIADRELVRQIFQDHPDIAATLHFAARIVVPESVESPALYYRENVMGSLELFDTLLNLRQSRIIFSSSASVYDSPAEFEVTESSSLNPLSPYARSKYITELMLADLCHAASLQGAPLRAIALRYFNPIGADPHRRSGPYIEEPSHLLGRLIGAAREGQPFTITGTDYATRDGTGLRDYIHVWDLALAHVAALEHFENAFEQASGAGNAPTFLVINLGTGQGVTVREMVDAFKRVWTQDVQVEEGPRRAGDSAGSYANTTRANEWLHWSPTLSIDDGIRSALTWTEHWKSRPTPHA